MTEMEITMLRELASCEPGRGIMCNSTRTKRAIGRLISKGWADSLEAGGIYVARITDAGRAALAAQ